jgi:DNA-binding NarL/FixJ family response regulator
MQLPIRDEFDETSDSRTDGNENRLMPKSSDSENSTMPLANKILLCSADESVSKRWQEALSGVGEPSALSSLDALWSHLKSNQTELVLVDLGLFGPDYRKVPELLSQPFPAVSFIVLSPLPNDDEGLYLISQGVKGYCNRYISEALLIKAVELVSMGEIWVGRTLLYKLMSRLGSTAETAGETRDTEAKLADLTEREREIAQLVGAGDSNKVIANKLDITERTVKAHLSAIFRKSGTRDRLQLGLLINR